MARFIREAPERMIGDRAYDSDQLDAELRKKRVRLIAPHRGNRKRKATQDGRELRRYKRRWKIERLFAWIGNFRRTVTRYEYHSINFLGFVQLACAIILMRQLF
jgi:transposase